MRWKLVFVCLLFLTTGGMTLYNGIASPLSGPMPSTPSPDPTRAVEAPAVAISEQHYLPLVTQAILDQAMTPTVERPTPTTVPAGVFGAITQMITPTVQRLAIDLPAPNSAIFVDPTTGWIATDHALLATVDGGTSWTTIYTSAVPLTSLDMVSAQDGWMIAGEQLVATHDGGASWQGVPFPGTSPTVSAIDLVDASHGFLTTDHHSFLRTTDGGATWTTVSYPPCEYQYGDHFSFPTQHDGWVLCLGEGGTPIMWKQLWRTQDGGVTWTFVALADEQHTDLPSGYVLDMVFLDAQQGWMSTGFQGMNWLVHTNDGGQTWQFFGSDFTESDGSYAGAMHFSSATHGVLVMERVRSAVMTTADGGVTWQQVYPALRPTGKLWFFDDRNGIGMGYPTNPDAVLHTSDGGNTWTLVGEVAPGCTGEITNLSFPTPLHGWATAVCGDETTDLYRSSDGGVTWTQLMLPTDPTNRSTAVSFVDSQTGYVGTIYDVFVTHDGGDTFQLGPVPGRFPEFRFITELHGWARGDGTLLETTDGGRSWLQIVIPLRVWDYDLGHDGLGWMTADCGGYDCTLLTTHDNGRTWTRIFFKDLRVKSITFADPQHGWLFGTLGGLYVTNDGGANWKQIS